MCRSRGSRGLVNRGTGDGHLVDRPTVLICLALFAACTAIVVPYVLDGPGFFMDDWRNRARLDTVGWMRAGEATRFASRPGAWAVETVLFAALSNNAFAWVVALVVVNSAAALALFLAFRQFATEALAVSVVLVWIALPNHTSLRVFANTAPMMVGLTLLGIGVLLMDRDRLVVGAVAVAAGGLCYEVMLAPGLVALVLIHRFRSRGTRREAAIGCGIVIAIGCLMLIHPTYRPGVPPGAAPGRYSLATSPVA